MWAPAGQHCSTTMIVSPCPMDTSATTHPQRVAPTVPGCTHCQQPLPLSSSLYAQSQRPPSLCPVLAQSSPRHPAAAAGTLQSALNPRELCQSHQACHRGQARLMAPEELLFPHQLCCAAGSAGHGAATGCPPVNVANTQHPMGAREAPTETGPLGASPLEAPVRLGAALAASRGENRARVWWRGQGAGSCTAPGRCCSYPSSAESPWVPLPGLELPASPAPAAIRVSCSSYLYPARKASTHHQATPKHNSSRWAHPSSTAGSPRQLARGQDNLAGPDAAPC